MSDDTYSVQVYCNNCYEWEGVDIPKGVPSKGFAYPPCFNCGHPRKKPIPASVYRTATIDGRLTMRFPGMGGMMWKA